MLFDAFKRGWRASGPLVWLILVLVVHVETVAAFDWKYVIPNPSYSRDLAMGMSTVATFYAPQSQSINPAGLAFADIRDNSLHASLLINPGGAWDARKYLDSQADEYSNVLKAVDVGRLLIHGAVVQSKIFTMAVLLSEPVMESEDTVRYSVAGETSPLDLHKNSLLMSLNLHRRVAIGGRINRYYDVHHTVDNGFAYGVILRPRGVDLGVQYEHFTNTVRHAHPLDRRSSNSTTAGIAINQENFSATLQVMNLTQSKSMAFLEPHVGMEWRILRAFSLRAGGMQFSGSGRWAVTTGFGLLDANWLRARESRLVVPDEVIQVAVGVIYNKHTAEQGIASLTLAWRL